MKKEKIINFDVCSNSEEEIIKNIWNDYNNNNQNTIININPEIVINNYKNKDFVNKMNSEKYQIPDGIGIVYASKIKKGNIKKRITGIDFMKRICDESRKYGAKIFLYGAESNVIEKAKYELEQSYPGINIVGVCNGYVKTEDAVSKINKSNADIIFIGTGSPKQEYFIFENKEKLEKVKILMPVGGSFDVISNQLKRAPIWIQNLNLEWLYRLAKQPKRFFRQIKLINFIIYIIFKDRKN